jgi:hypothetical protein
MISKETHVCKTFKNSFFHIKVFKLSPKLLQKRQVVYIDIANDSISSNVTFT